MIKRSAAILLCVTLAACSRETWRNADLQLDISKPLPAAATQVRLCVQDVGSRTLGAGGDRYAIPGLPTGGDLQLTVDVLQEGAAVDTGVEFSTIARAGPVTLGASQKYTESALDESLDSIDSVPCTAGEGFAQEGETTWLLAVRFLES